MLDRTLFGTDYTVLCVARSLNLNIKWTMIMNLIRICSLWHSGFTCAKSLLVSFHDISQIDFFHVWKRSLLYKIFQILKELKQRNRGKCVAPSSRSRKGRNRRPPPLPTRSGSHKKNNLVEICSNCVIWGLSFQKFPVNMPQSFIEHYFRFISKIGAPRLSDPGSATASSLIPL